MQLWSNILEWKLYDQAFNPFNKSPPKYPPPTTTATTTPVLSCIYGNRQLRWQTTCFQNLSVPEPVCHTSNLAEQLYKQHSWENIL